MITTQRPTTCSGKAAHAKVIVLCLLCTLVYVYLYSEVSFQTLAIRNLMKGTLDDFRTWHNQIEGWVESLTNGTFFKANIDIFQKYDMKSNQMSKGSRIFAKSNNLSALKNNFKYGIIGEGPFLTIFTTWPDKAEKYTCHNNTVANWMSMAPYVQAVLFTNEPNLAKKVKENGWRVFPVKKMGRGIPILKNMYMDVMEAINSTFYAYSNGDILFTDSIITTLVAVLKSNLSSSKPLMVIGRRTNVKDVSYNDGSRQERIKWIAKSRGSLFSVWAEDFFITMKNYPWKEIPEVVVGRRAYDNWLVLDARKRGNVIDASETLLAVHQTTKSGNFEGHGHKNSDYNHNLLVRRYRRLHYGAGLTSCAEYFTRYSSNNNPKIQKRVVPKSCFPL